MLIMMWLIYFAVGRDQVRSILFSVSSNQLISAGLDSMLVSWSMDAKRLPVILQLFLLRCTSKVQ